ncbi:MAG: ComEC/Rec2 family competence protein [Candidatus Gribaldobacteria bacterium]|nr:ComEC/Rec2 family competence protein [Candidatus Gribaldobacteria bacterium]
MASLVSFPNWLIYELFLLSFLYLIIFYRQKLIIVFSLGLICLGLGALRTNQVNTRVMSLSVQNNSSNQVSLWREKLASGINQNLAPPYSVILEGIVLGGQKGISFEWKQKLNITGTRHITAVSGMNIVILAQMLVILGLFLGLWRQQALFLALILIWFYIIFIGFPASALRAGIMASLLLIAQILGRQNLAQRTIILAAAVMLVFSPLALKSDWGFQLSFLATLGLLYLAPTLIAWLDRVSFFKKLGLSEATGTTLAAQAFTAPLLIYNTGNLSLVAPLANVLIAPIITLTMVLGFALVLTHLVSPVLGWAIAWPCQFLMGYLVSVIDVCSKIPLASLRFHFTGILVLVCYLGLAFWAWKIKQASQFPFRA